ncbi:MAG: phospholipid carrier-dependent glycosyltransferase [Opitutaceae bacterium]|nr:phospholipid carrier-dependent glycosyltransferase [Opitutaceae bacterium]
MRKSLLVSLCFVVAWAAGALGWVALQKDDPLLDQDEVYWIGSAYYYDLAWVRRDWRHEAWRLLPARENPPVCKYVLGLGLATAGHRVESIENLAYFYLKWLRWENPAAVPTNAAEEKRAAVVRAAGPEFMRQVLDGRRAPLPRPVVGAARTTVLVCAVLGSLSLLLLGWSVGDRVAGLVASVLLLVHPVAASAASHAMSDTIALLFAVAAAWAVTNWYRRLAAPDGPRGLGPAVLAGVALGLACAAKMNALVLVLLAGALTAIAMAQRWRAGAGRGVGAAARQGIAVLVVALALFVAINPAILADFPRALAAPIMEHRLTEATQVDLHDPHPAGLGGKLAAVARMAFYGWEFFAVMAGLVAWCAVRRWREPAVRVAVIWWGLALASVTLWLPFAWPRYVLPLLAPSAWIAGLALTAAWQAAVRRNAAASP